MRYFCFLFSLCLLLSGCSVHKAASNEGILPEDIYGCTTRSAFLAKGMSVVLKNKQKDGKEVEIYRSVCRKSGANYVRAAGHAVLDVCTLGLWEVVGTPLEGTLSDNRGFVTARVTYPYEGAEHAEKVEIFDPQGRRLFPEKVHVCRPVCHKPTP